MKWLKKQHIQMLLALIIGVIFGLVLPGLAVELRFIGRLFILALKMVIAPLILTSMMVGVAQIGDMKHLANFGGKTIVYYFSTTFIAVALGILFVNIIQPGRTEPVVLQPEDVKVAIQKLNDEGLQLPQVQQIEEITDLKQRQLVTLFARLHHRGFAITKDDIQRAISTSSQDKTLGAALLEQVEKMLVNPFQSLTETNTLGIIFFAILVGIIAMSLGSKAEPFLKFITSANHVMFKVVDVIIMTAPVGILFLIAGIVAENTSNWQEFLQLFQSVGIYFLTVVVGLAVHGLVILPLILWIFGRMTPLTFFKGMRTAFLTAFSTSSSSATLPLTLNCIENNLKVPNKVSNFVLPIGATINMDGTALYESVAVIFIANFMGIDLSLTQQIIIFFTATLAAIGAAAIPSAGLVTMTIVLSAVGLPASGIVIILSVDRFLDMIRTTINVEGDAVGAVVIHRLTKEN